MTSTQERGRRSSPLPASPSIIKLYPCEWSQGLAPSCPPACEPHKRPILTDRFPSLTLPLVEFFSVLRHKGLWYQRLFRAPKTTPKGFAEAQLEWGPLYISQRWYQMLSALPLESQMICTFKNSYFFPQVPEKPDQNSTFLIYQGASMWSTDRTQPLTWKRWGPGTSSTAQGAPPASLSALSVTGIPLHSPNSLRGTSAGWREGSFCSRALPPSQLTCQTLATVGHWEGFSPPPFFTRASPSLSLSQHSIYLLWRIYINAHFI